MLKSTQNIEVIRDGIITNKKDSKEKSLNKFLNTAFESNTNCIHSGCLRNWSQ
ncbi:hypothetical protein LEP1GSC178_2329 [Leptospira licerasiae str. MMD4847]|uniref:Uncharacterized protein n=1 Tax=Leptospira licerasiae str. MMD4847 TaxID=1049971 RepID=A0ABN0HE47_9LEPT|nr:hypothetical protein LEP1GSC178_2329 [Leptospira licerasiae str. MMD4847]